MIRPKISKAETERLLVPRVPDLNMTEQQVFRANRAVWLLGSIDHEMATNAIRVFMLYAGESSEPVTLYLDSSGGQVQAALALMDVMRLIPCPINIMAYGQVCSAAMGILACGTIGRRVALRNTAFMFHQFSTGYERASLHEAVGDCQELEREEQAYQAQFKLLQNPVPLELRGEKEYRFDAVRAKKINLIDKIL